MHLPEYWAVKNDGSQRFKNTVIVYMNRQIGTEIYDGSGVDMYYGFDGAYENYHNLQSYDERVEVLTLNEFILATGNMVQPVFLTTN